MSTPLTRNGEIVFVTGATGYVGSVVAEKLCTSGYTVRGLTRRAEGVDFLRDKGIEPVVGDVHDIDLMAKAALGAYAVVHTAAPNDPTRFKSIEEMIDSVLRAVEIMVKTAQVNDARLLVTSGTSVYGHTSGKIVDETAPLQPMPGTERLVQLETQLIERRQAYFIRPAVVFGRNQSAPMLKFMEAIRDRGTSVLVNPENRLSIVEVDALADLYQSILEAEEPPQLVNAVSAILGWPEVMKAIAKAVDASSEPEIIAPNEAMVFGGPAMYMPIDMAVSSELARSSLGWQPNGPTFEESLTKDRQRPQEKLP